METVNSSVVARSPGRDAGMSRGCTGDFRALKLLCVTACCYTFVKVHGVCTPQGEPSCEVWHLVTSDVSVFAHL